MSWHEIPFIRLLLPFVMGIVVSEFLPYLPYTYAVYALIVTFIIVFVLNMLKASFRYRWLFGIPLSIFLFLGSYVLAFYNNELNHAAHFRHYIEVDKETILVGIVTDKSERINHHRLVVGVQSIVSEKNTSLKASGNALIYIKKDSLEAPPQYGDLIVTHIKLREMEPLKNPHAFDFKQYWHLQNIHYQGFINFDDITVKAQGEGNPIMSLALRCQNHFVQLLKNAFGAGDEWAVGSALLLGNKEAISDEIRNAYIETGAMHILAISGMHILLIFQMLDKILSLYKSGNRQWRWLKTGILVTVTILFSLLVGLGASVLRAAVMASFMSISKAMWRRVNILNVLAASAMVLLLYNPLWLFDVGFQLSYVAVAGIVYFAPFFQKLLVFEFMPYSKVWANISVGLAAQLAVTPLALYYFHQFPVWFWLTGLLVGVVADGALIVGIVYFIVSSIPVLNSLVSEILFGLLWVMNKLVFIVDKLPVHLIDGFWLPLWLVGCLYIALLFLVRGIVLRKLQPINMALCSTLFLIALYGFSDITKKPIKQIIAYHIPQNTLIDVIHGDSCHTYFKKFSKNISAENKIKFAADNHRKALKIKGLNIFDINKYCKNNYLLYQHNVICYDGYIVLVLDKLPINSVNLHVNTVILSDNPRFDIEELMQLLTFDTLVFDASNSQKRVKQWIEDCQKLGVKYHDIASNGAWVQNF
jgi:competence protein ComEC